MRRKLFEFGVKELLRQEEERGRRAACLGMGAVGVLLLVTVTAAGLVGAQVAATGALGGAAVLAYCYACLARKPGAVSLREMPSDKQWAQLLRDSGWEPAARLVVKADIAAGNRQEAGLVRGAAAGLPAAEAWQAVAALLGSTQTVGGVTGEVTQVLLEPYQQHSGEHYLALESTQCEETGLCGTRIVFSAQGGVGFVADSRTSHTHFIPVDRPFELPSRFFGELAPERRSAAARFVRVLYRCFRARGLHFLEINPFAFDTFGKPVTLGARAEADDVQSPGLSYAPVWGRRQSPEEAEVHALNASVPAAFALTVLDWGAPVWLLVAGGGASMAYADLCVQLGMRIGNYGEYSGNPTHDQCHSYARAVCAVATRAPPQGPRVLIVGGNVSNGTDIRETLKGFAKAMLEYREALVNHRFTVFARRGGLHYQDGLRALGEACQSIGLPYRAFGPETPMMRIVHDAAVLQRAQRRSTAAITPAPPLPPPPESDRFGGHLSPELFTSTTTCIVCVPPGWRLAMAQRILDFDDAVSRPPSVVAVACPGLKRPCSRTMSYGSSTIEVPTYCSVQQAAGRHPQADVLLCCGPAEVAVAAALSAMNSPVLRTLVVVSEGVTEQSAQRLQVAARRAGKCLIGPSSYGAVRAGCFRCGSLGGTAGNVLDCGLERAGSIAVLGISSGLVSEVFRVIHAHTDGVYEAIAVGGDNWMGSSFADHCLRYERIPQVKVIVIIGEVGGDAEVRVARLLKHKVLTKAVVACVLGECAEHINTEVQFGHTRSRTDARLTASAKKAALEAAGGVVVPSFGEFERILPEVWRREVARKGRFPDGDMYPSGA